MLLVDGEPVSASASPTFGSSRGVRLLGCWRDFFPPRLSPSRFLQGSGGRELVAALMGNPGLRAASERLRAEPERRISSGPEEDDADAAAAAAPRHVYVFQREFATVDPARVELVGTDEVTTCVGVVIRNNKTGMTSISHMDFPKIVEGGLKQMLYILLEGSTSNRKGIPIHYVAGYLRCCISPGSNSIFVETSSGAVNPASFEMNSRCPDEIVRRIRVSVSSYDPNWQGRLLETYDTHSDAFEIAPACWMPDWAEMASSLNQLSDSEVLLQCSTSPAAEPPHFVENERRIWRYLIENPYWQDTFPKYKPRVFHRTSDGRCLCAVGQCRFHCTLLLGRNCASSASTQRFAISTV
uniref:Protein N-terminal asparagine amidohydrolase n=1 Tax=Oryza rufipogon TaxID=4529 RepID=A0A0E0Q074_ORYRU